MPDVSFHPATLAAALEQFDALLRASGSATRTLETWAAEHHGASAATLVAHVRALRAPTADENIMHRLKVARWSDIHYRRVWLASGNRIFSVAENWYVPSRLDDAMARRLSDGATPFGAVIAPLAPTRETLETERLWDDAALGEGEKAMPLPPALLRHHALVRSGNGTALCEVRETYTRNILLKQQFSRC